MQNPLSKPLRTQLENTIKAARDVAERAALAALNHLGVGDAKWPEHLVEDAQKSLRRRLREHGRSLGDGKHKDDSQDLTHLKWEVAYEHWHRMLFARFLAENNLLLWEPGAPVTLAECEELAQDPSTSFGAKSGWELASKLAARMLPQVFKPNSPVFELRLSPNEQRDLENLLKDLPTETFRASDSLGWVYQFWQASRKNEVNASEAKIGADELPAVTQLFTEPYMVEFLLHNSLGAWWHTHHPSKPCPVELTYLRILDDGAPAAGKFESWPDTLAKFKLLDPCCGSGHFLVSAFLLLVPMRMATEGLSAKASVNAVLRDNLHGLEIDPRCVEIAVFALAFAAWRFPDESGHPLGVRADMPAPKIACCGLKVSASSRDWEALVPDSATNAQLLRQELRLLHASFTQAPLLGSLIDPAKTLRNDLATSSAETLRDLLERALSNESRPIRLRQEQEINDRIWDLALTAQGLMNAAQLLADRYQLVVTNVPYLARGNHCAELIAFVDKHHRDARADLATVFIERCIELSSQNGLALIVSPQNWWFLGSYSTYRKRLLADHSFRMIVALGEEAWETFGNRGPLATLLFLSIANPNNRNMIAAIDASKAPTINEKKAFLKNGEVLLRSQRGLENNPDSRILFEEIDTSSLLSSVCRTHVGFQNGDSPRFLRRQYELPGGKSSRWSFIQMPPSNTGFAVGFDSCLSKEFESNVQFASSWHSQSAESFGQAGVLVRNMRDLTCTAFLGGYFDQSATAITCDRKLLPALWSFLTSSDYRTAVRQLDSAVKVTPATLGKVPFDSEKWMAVAIRDFPNGLPQPSSNDPTQWIFHGHPQPANDPLQVAVMRLLGYVWPAESDERMELSGEARTWISRCKFLTDYTDDDGIVCLPAVRGEKPAHERLLALLIDAWETVEPGSWKPAILDRLLADVDCTGKGLDVWLREEFFAQHAKRFQHRPFIWHIWDGLKDGFGALVNCHKLDNKNLERLIHTYLGDWIRNQEQGVKSGIDGAQTRLAAARNLKTRLEAILEGEAPYDIFVRWKPLAEQPIGWNPDLNDGVRLNIRPFMQAEALRHNKKPKLNITWDKDRGKDVDTAPWFAMFKGERINDHHLTLEEKRRSRG